jgi:hypothetical protein
LYLQATSPLSATSPDTFLVINVTNLKRGKGGAFFSFLGKSLGIERVPHIISFFFFVLKRNKILGE